MTVEIRIEALAASSAGLATSVAPAIAARSRINGPRSPTSSNVVREQFGRPAARRPRPMVNPASPKPMNPTCIAVHSSCARSPRTRSSAPPVLQVRVARDFVTLQKNSQSCFSITSLRLRRRKCSLLFGSMRPLIRPITIRRRSITNRSRLTPLAEHNRNLTALHFQILEWVEGRRSGGSRPQIDGLSSFAIDGAVAELVLEDLIKAVSIPRSRYDRAHWEPTGLTASGWRTLLRHRRTQPQPVTHSWWPLRIWG